MKITLSMQEASDDDIGNAGGASNYSNDGVKRIIVLGIVQDIPETYHNVELLLKELDIESISYYISSDLKLINILLGKVAAIDQVKYNMVPNYPIDIFNLTN